MQRDAYTKGSQKRPERKSEEESLSRGADSQAETSMCAHLGGTTTREAVVDLSYKIFDFFVERITLPSFQNKIMAHMVVVALRQAAVIPSARTTRVSNFQRT